MNDEPLARSRNHSDQSSESGMFDILGVIIRGKWIILGTFLGSLALTIFLIVLIGPVYEAAASVIINTRMAQTPAPLFSDASAGASSQKIIQNELEILKSRFLADKVAESLLNKAFLDHHKSIPILIIQPLDDSYEQVATLDQIVRRLERSVDFTHVLESDVIRVTVKSKDPLEAALIANTYAQAYHDRNMDVSRARSRSVREYLQTELKQKQQALTKVEDSLKLYMEQKGVVSLDDEAKKTIDQLSALKADRDAVDIQIRTLTTTFSSYQVQLTSQEKDFSSAIGQSNDPYIRLLQEQLAKLEVQRDMTATQNPTIASQELYGAKLKELDNQIAALRANLQTRTNEFLRTILPATQEGGTTQGPADYLKRIKQRILETQIEIQSLQAKRGALDEPIRQYENQFERIPAKSMQYARLQRDKQSAEKLYLMLDEKFNQASLIEQSEFGSVDIFDPAVAPVEPSNSRTLLILLLGMFLGVGSGLALVFIREHVDPKVYHPTNVKNLGYVVLSTVGIIKHRSRRFMRESSINIKGKTLDACLVTISQPSSTISESYRHIRTSLRYSRNEQRFHTILVTSGKVGEGKSTTIANLSVAFANEGKHVLLIDADLRDPVIHSYFHVLNSPGLSDFLMGETFDQISIRKTVVTNLHVIPSGKLPLNPSELLGSDKMRALLNEAISEYDLILIDSPPVLAVTDPCVVASLVDQVIVVASAGETSQRELQRTIELLHEVQGRAPTIVLNKFDPRFSSGVIFGQAEYGYHPYGQVSKRTTNEVSIAMRSQKHIN